MKDLHFGLTESKSSFELAEAFSIGLTLIDCVLLTDSSDLYNLTNFRINYQKLDERRSAIRSSGNIDDLLRQTILGLTALDSSQRLVSWKVFEWMDQYRENIVNMVEFQPTQLPPWASHQL